jgi:hypothetical protein
MFTVQCSIVIFGSAFGAALLMTLREAPPKMTIEH